MGKALDKFKRKLGTFKNIPGDNTKKTDSPTTIPAKEVRKRSYARIISAIDLELERRWVQNNGKRS